MNFNLSEEQQMLKDSLNRFLTNEYDAGKRQQIIDSGKGIDAGTWQALAEMGLLGFTFPEDYDGLGGNGIDTMIVMECFGRALLVEPYLATVVLAGSLVSEAGSNDQKTRILPAITAGEHTMALAHSEPGARYNLNHVHTTARRDGDDYVLSGQKTAVLHGAQARELIVSARTSGNPDEAEGISLFLVRADSAGLNVTDFATHDGNRTAEMTLENVRVSADAVLGPLDKAAPLIEQATDRAIAALCAEAVGTMEALNAATLEYAQTRKQFGVPIGKFQVLQHRMADMFIDTEQAKSMAILAACDVDSDARDSRRNAVSMAKTLVGQNARKVGQAAVQIHGGMGVTDEMFAAHLFKRLTLINLLFGNADHHLAQVSDQLLKETA